MTMPNLNLIPPQQKTDLRQSIVIRHWRRAVTMMMLFALLGLGFGITSYVLLRQHAGDVAAQLEKLDQQRKQDAATDLPATTTSLNTTIKTISELLGQPQSWSRDNAVILGIVPSGVTVTNLTLQLNHRFRLTGTADTRSTFLELDQAMKGSKLLTQVVTPSTASKRLAVPFDYSGFVLPATTTP